jgi:DNA polymerase
MAAALAAALPAKLETVAEVLELPVRKDAEGARLMLLMARSRKPRAGEDPNKIYWHDDPEKLERLYKYCQNDVEVERALYKCLPPLIEAEQASWALDAAVNARGFYTDGLLLEASHKVVTAADAALQAEFRELTGLDSTNQVEKFIAWLAKRGAKSPTYKKEPWHALSAAKASPPRCAERLSCAACWRMRAPTRLKRCLPGAAMMAVCAAP